MTKIVGITGGIGSGKTTFSNHLKKLGYMVHESDAVVSQLYTKPKKEFLTFIKEKISQSAVRFNKINKLEKKFDLVVCIISSKKNRIKRVLKNKKFTKENLNKIIKAQTSNKERRKRSQIIINNNKTKKDFIFSAEKVLTRLIK